MNNEVVEEIKSIQATFVASANSFLMPNEIEDLCCLVRLTVLFNEYLIKADARNQISPIDGNLEYNIESIFSGITSFCVIRRAYSVLTGAESSGAEFDMISDSWLREEFIRKYKSFREELSFAPACRLILDLFRIQIIFSGLLYR